MKTPLKTMYQIEMFKLLKRKDWLALLALAGIGILFGMSVLSGNYSGPSSQSALFWICTQIFNSSILMVTPIVFAFVSTRMLAGEIENGSITLYTCRYRNRRGFYFAKSLAVLTFSLFTFVLMILLHLGIYFFFTVRNPSVASRTLTGENTFLLLITLAAVYLSSFLLTSQFALFLSAYLKSAPVIGIVFMAALLFHNTWRIPYLRNLNPWYYVVRLGSDAAGTTKALPINYGETVGLFAAFCILSLIYTLLFHVLALKKWETIDLN